MNVRLLTKTTGEVGTEYEGKSIDEIIAGIARLSSSREVNDLFKEPEKLLRHCLLNGHWSVFTEGNLTFEIVTSRAIGRELLRHWSIRPQELCLSGDSEIYFDSPQAIVTKRKSRSLYKLKISDLYRKWNKDQFLQNRIKNMYVRVFDDIKGSFTHAHILDVIATGKKEVFEITLENGKTLKSTKDHKFFIKNKGWMTLERAIGLDVTGNKLATFKNFAEFATNGILSYKDFEWMEKAKMESLTSGGGVSYIADKAGISYYTVRKWLKFHGLQFTKKETASIFPIWNKGLKGYSWGSHSEESKEKMRVKARRGSDSNLWRGGVDRTEREKIGTWLDSIRNSKLRQYSYKCRQCGAGKNFELHHIVPVYKDISKAYDYDNIEVLCRYCHLAHHKSSGDYGAVKPKTTRALKIPSYSKIKSVKYIGLEDTFDLHIDHASHNYVANGLVVHNSQRYVEIDSFESIELRLQSRNNRQSSTDIIEDQELISLANDAVDSSVEVYKKLLASGVARECARLVLPETAQTKLIMNGTIREWITTLNQRLHKTAQKECRLVAEAIRDIFIRECPITSQALFNFEYAYDIHILDRLVLEKYKVFDQVMINKS